MGRYRGNINANMRMAINKPERGLEQILPSQPLEGTNLADTLILDSKPPELRQYISVV